MKNNALWMLTAARLKEFAREPGALFWTFGFPLLLTMALGIAFRTQGPPKAKVAVVGSEVLAQKLAGRFEVLALSQADADKALRTGKAALIVEEAAPDLIYRFDPTRPDALPAKLAVDDALERAAGRADVITAREVHVSAPGARYVDWLVPGLLGMQLMSGSMWGIGWGVVQMRQRKLLKRLLATPMRRADFLLSFMLSRLVAVVWELATLIGFAYFAFKVEVRGSLVAMSAVSVLGAASFAGIGLLCSARAQNSETASGLINLVMLPMFVLSGVFFSAVNFPHWLQPAIRLLPLTALNDALRMIINDGASIAAVRVPIVILAGWGAVTFAAALRVFRWN